MTPCPSATTSLDAITDFTAPADVALDRHISRGGTPALKRIIHSRTAFSPTPPTHTTAAYRRVLWLVAGLNFVLGVVEAVSGYVAGSQALKADALDSLGDGVITGLGLIALNWGAGARNRAALAQGVFLALMGLGVFAATLYRVLVTQVPEAMIMGSFGLIAIAVNVLSAVILLRYREGDANVRAVWLFSRNDAIGNAAVVAAALAVVATGSPLPDLLTAAAIAGLFIHSAVRIVGDALDELKAIR